MTRYDALQYLLRTYYHPDWAEDHDNDPWNVVLDFARSDPEVAGRVRQEIGEILSSNMTETEVRRLVIDDLDSGYRVEAVGWTYLNWLDEVAKRVNRYLRMRGPHTCPICGYVGLVYEPRTSAGRSSYEHCPCCEFIFGTTEAKGYSDEQWRQRWIDRGMPWESGNLRPPPDDWDPHRQLRRLLGSDDGSAAT
jgi:hypothetical protein